MKPTPEQVAEIVRLHHVENWKIGTIARQLKISRRRVRRALGIEPWVERRSRPSMLMPYLGHLVEWLQQYPTLRATRIYDMLQQRGYAGSVRTVREHVARLRPRQPKTTFVETTTLPGEVAQVDWAHVGKLKFGIHERTVSLFVITLGHSRALWGEFVLEQTAASMTRSLCRAAQYFGGVTRKWLFDNTKAVVLERVGQAERLNPLLLDVAIALRVEPRLCGPYQPHHKGKVERAIRYLRDRFLAGRTIRSIDEANAQLLDFLARIDAQRPHPTLKPRTVGEVFVDEKAALLALPSAMPETDAVIAGRADSQANVVFDGNRYSVPAIASSAPVLIKASDVIVSIFHDAACVATHARCWSRNARIEIPEHRIATIKNRPRARDGAGRERLRLAAPGVDELLQALLKNGHNIGLCTARLLKQLDLYGADIFRVALDDVLAHGKLELAAFNFACESARRKAQPHTPVAASFAEHVDDRDVIPHDLENYDD